MSCARGVAGGAGAVIGVMGSGVASRAVVGMSSLHIVSAKPSLLTDARIRAAYSEGAGIYRILPRAAARDFGLRLPPDPSSGAFATSGGMASTNAAGPRSLRYGSVRRWIETVEIVGTDGASRWVKRGAGSGERFAL